MAEKLGKLIYMNRTPQNLDQMERLDVEALQGRSRVKIALPDGPSPIPFKEETNDGTNC